VLDLSICWVCGEMVARGEEVVSLGWCFWHRACFGCLLCGTRLEAPAVEDEEEFADEGHGGHEGERDCLVDCSRVQGGRIQKKGKRGVELEYIPLCQWCENATEGMPGKELLETGLANVTKRDGGMARSRLDMLSRESETADANAPIIPAGTPGQSRAHGEFLVKGAKEDDEDTLPLFAVDSTRRGSLDSIMTIDKGLMPSPLRRRSVPGVPPIPERSPRRKTTPWPRSSDTTPPPQLNRASTVVHTPRHSRMEVIGRDPPTYEPADATRTGGHVAEAAYEPLSPPVSPPIYVSMTNILGEPAFRPSKTKPVPRWMQYLPSSRRQSLTPTTDCSAASPAQCGNSDGTMSPPLTQESTISIHTSTRNDSSSYFARSQDDRSFTGSVDLEESNDISMTFGQPTSTAGTIVQRRDQKLYSPFNPPPMKVDIGINSKTTFTIAGSNNRASIQTKRTQETVVDARLLSRAADRPLVTPPTTPLVPKPATRGVELASPSGRLAVSRGRNSTRVDGVWKKYMARKSDERQNEFKRHKTSDETTPDLDAGREVRSIGQRSPPAKDLGVHDRLRMELKELFNEE
jgi:hypothetical protein